MPPMPLYLFFQLASRCYERGSLLLTSNRSVGEWGEVFGDPVVATAILDRVLHHSHVVTIRGESYRLREKRRSGLVKTAQQTSTPNQGGQFKCRWGGNFWCRLTASMPHLPPWRGLRIIIPRQTEVPRDPSDAD